MTKGNLNNLDKSFVQNLSNNWALVTSGASDNYNMMTVNWGGIGFLWNKPVLFIFIRPERYTFEFIEKYDYFSLSFLKDNFSNVHEVCGMQSGRYINKIKETNLNPIITKNGCMLFEESILSVECKKIYSHQMSQMNYENHEFHSMIKDKGSDHKMYIAEIIDIWVND